MQVQALTAEQLLHIMPRAHAVIADWVTPLEQAMSAFGITNTRRAQMFIANIAHESVELTQLEESFRYTHADRLMTVFPRRFHDLSEAQRYVVAGPQAIASRVYADRLGNGDEASGDGWTFRGRGPNGLTFKANYEECSLTLCGDDSTFVDNPEFIVLPDFGAMSAAWYWDMSGCARYADVNDFDGVCDTINQGHKTVAMGDSNGYNDRLHYLKLAMEVI